MIPRCLKFIKNNIIWMRKGHILTKLHIYFLFRFLNYDWITLIIFQCKFSISFRSCNKLVKLLLVEGEALCPLLVALASITLLVFWMAGFGRFVIGEQSKSCTNPSKRSPEFLKRELYLIFLFGTTLSPSLFAYLWGHRSKGRHEGPQK